MLAGLWASPQVSESALYPLLSQAPFCHFRAAVMFSEAFWVVRKSIGPGLWWGQFSAQRAGGGGGRRKRGAGEAGGAQWDFSTRAWDSVLGQGAKWTQPAALTQPCPCPFLYTVPTPEEMSNLTPESSPE